MSKKQYKYERELGVYMSVVADIVGGSGQEENWNPLQKEMLDLHTKLVTEDESYKETFNKYSQLTRSPAAAKMENQFYVVDQIDQRGETTKAFAMAVGTMIRHAPTFISLIHNENKIEKAFKENYTPKM